LPMPVQTNLCPSSLTRGQSVGTDSL
jgi:hypothetical protein